MKPTKFDIMRNNRDAAESADYRASVELAHMESKRKAPQVKTMEIDGVRYKEAPRKNKIETCKGCAFLHSEPGRCFGDGGIADIASDAFGGSCGSRPIIYIRAD